MPAHTIHNAQFITFEGGEGAGKSTQVKLLAAFLREQGLEVLVTREPGGSPRAEKIRAYILSGKAKKFGTITEAILFAVARQDHVRKTIRPALARGAWVLCDRFSDSSMAYQGYLGNVPWRFLQTLTRWAVGATTPDLTLVLDLPAEEGLLRANQRATPDRFEAEGIAFHQKLRSAFLDIAARNSSRCTVVSASGTVEQVEINIRHAVQARYPNRVTPGLEAP